MRERSRGSCQRTCDEINSRSVRKHLAHRIALAGSPVFVYAETPEAGFLGQTRVRGAAGVETPRPIQSS